MTGVSQSSPVWINLYVGLKFNIIWNLCVQRLLSLWLTFTRKDLVIRLFQIYLFIYFHKGKLLKNFYEFRELGGRLAKRADLTWRRGWGQLLVFVLFVAHWVSNWSKRSLLVPIAGLKGCGPKKHCRSTPKFRSFCKSACWPN